MRHEILKKTLIYRLLAYSVTILINLGSPLGTILSIIFATISEVASLVIYYVYEYYWRKLIENNNIKKGMNILLIKGEDDKHAWYEVIEVLEENKFVIRVV